MATICAAKIAHQKIAFCQLLKKGALRRIRAYLVWEPDHDNHAMDVKNEIDTEDAECMQQLFIAALLQGLRRFAIVRLPAEMVNEIK